MWIACISVIRLTECANTWRGQVNTS